MEGYKIGVVFTIAHFLWQFLYGQLMGLRQRKTHNPPRTPLFRSDPVPLGVHFVAPNAQCAHQGFGFPGINQWHSRVYNTKETSDTSASDTLGARHLLQRHTRGGVYGGGGGFVSKWEFTYVRTRIHTHHNTISFDKAFCWVRARLCVCVCVCV